MFVRGEYVFHESGGICVIDDVQKAPLDNMPADREYYVIKPLYDPNSVIYMPVDSDRIFVRRLLSKAEAEALLDRIPKVGVIEESNAKLLRQRYVELMRLHDPVEWVRVIKTVYLRTTEHTTPTRRISETECAHAETAKRNLHTELALALGLDADKMEAYISEHIQKMA